MKPRVLLIGTGGSHTTAEIPHVFWEAGCVVDIFCPRNSWLRKGSHWHQWHEAPTTETYPTQLKAQIQASAYDWLVPVDDAALSALAQAGPAGALPVTKQDSVELLGSKAGFSRRCRVYGITTPAYAVGEDEAGRLEESVGYPLLVKVDKSSGGTGVFKCSNAADVQALLARLAPEEKKDVVFQRYIPGDNISVEALYRQGVLCGYACSRVVHTLGSEFGISTERIYNGSLVPRSLLEMIGQSVGINGFSSMTFMRAADGTLYIIELDLRPQAWLWLAHFAGVDFAHAIRVYLGLETGLNVPPHHDIRVWHFYREVRRCIASGEWRELVRWAANKGGRWRFVPWYDKRLCAAIFRELAGLAVHKSLYPVYAKLTGTKVQ